jgi:hypothetical protein
MSGWLDITTVWIEHQDLSKASEEIFDVFAHSAPLVGSVKTIAVKSSSAQCGSLLHVTHAPPPGISLGFLLFLEICSLHCGGTGK